MLWRFVFFDGGVFAFIRMIIILRLMIEWFKEGNSANFIHIFIRVFDFASDTSIKEIFFFNQIHIDTTQWIHPEFFVSLETDFFFFCHLLFYNFFFHCIITAPEPDDPQDAVVARQFKDHPDFYRQTAKFWTYYFATDRSAEKRKQFESYEGSE